MTRSGTPLGRLLPALLVVATVAVYANSLGNPFVFDDLGAIVENRHLRQLWPLAESLTAPPQATVAGRPVVSLTLALNYAVGGLDVRGYHLLNLVVHVLCGLLLYGVVRRSLRSPSVSERWSERATPLAFAVALVWTLHPLGTEVINYVAQRTESIMALFYLSTLYCAIRAATHDTHSRAWSAAAIFACALGLASKESMVTAPVAVVLYDFAFGAGPLAPRLARRRGLYLGLAGSWILLAIILWTGPRSNTVGFDVGIGALDYAKNQCVLFVEYLRTAFWPHPLVFDYGDARPLPEGTVLPYALVVATLAASTCVAFLRRPAIGFCAVWVFLTLAPTSSFVPIASEVGAERRMYLPLMGLAVLAGVAALRALDAAPGWMRRPAARNRIAIVLLGIVATSLGIVSARRNLDYRSNETIWRSAVAARPTNPRAYNNLGQALHVAGKTQEAIEMYERTLALDAAYAQAHFNLGVALADLGRNDEAVAKYRRALELNPELDRAHHNLASELANQGRLEEAIAHFREAVRIAPESATGHQNLGRALRLTDRTEEALRQLREALRLEPEHPETLGDLAWILATHPDERFRDADEAVELAQRAVDATEGRHAVSLDTLAAAYAAAGAFDRAIEVAQRAIRTARDNGAAELEQEIALRAALYATREPYRESVPGRR